MGKPKIPDPFFAQFSVPVKLSFHIVSKCGVYTYKKNKHFKTMTQRLNFEGMFRILQYSSSVQGCLQICDYSIYKADNKVVLIINRKNYSSRMFTNL